MNIRAKIQSYLRSGSGSTAGEFAMLAPIIIYLFFMCVYLAYILTSNFMINRAADRVTEMLRPQLMESNVLTQAEIYNVICDQVSVIMSCDSDKLKIYLVNWKSAPTTPPAQVENVWDLAAGEPVHHLQIGYEMAEILPALGFLLGNGGAAGKQISTSMILTTKEAIRTTR